MSFRSWLAEQQKLDLYHKAFCPTIQIALTVFAIIAAWKVLGVQQENAQRSNKELEHRIEKLSEFNKVLEKQNADQNAQQERINEAEVQSATNLKTSLKVSASLMVESFDALHDTFDKTQVLVAGTGETVNLRIGNMALLQSRLPNYTDDEKLLLNTFAKLAKAELDATHVYKRDREQFQETLKQLRADRKKATKNASDEEYVMTLVEYCTQLKSKSDAHVLKFQKEHSEAHEKRLNLFKTANELAGKIAKDKK